MLLGFNDILPFFFLNNYCFTILTKLRLYYQLNRKRAFLIKKNMCIDDVYIMHQNIQRLKIIEFVIILVYTFLNFNLF